MRSHYFSRVIYIGITSFDCLLEYMVFCSFLWFFGAFNALYGRLIVLGAFEGSRVRSTIYGDGVYAEFRFRVSVYFLDRAGVAEVGCSRLATSLSDLASLRTSCEVYFLEIKAGRRSRIYVLYSVLG